MSPHPYMTLKTVSGERRTNLNFLFYVSISADSRTRSAAIVCRRDACSQSPRSRSCCSCSCSGRTARGGTERLPSTKRRPRCTQITQGERLILPQHGPCKEAWHREGHVRRQWRQHNRDHRRTQTRAPTLSILATISTLSHPSGRTITSKRIRNLIVLVVAVLIATAQTHEVFT